MAISLYDISVPVFVKHLQILKHILEKAEQWAKDNNVPAEDLLTARLAPDMLPLTFQIQVVSNASKNAVVRIARVEPVPMDDNEKTFEELYARIDKTVEVIQAAPKSKFEGRESEDITYQQGGKDITINALTALLTQSLPNFFFHVTTAYNILRNKGVPLGKGDYLRGKDA
jgi:hypothetical protein